MFVLETRLGGDFLDGETSFSEQAAGTDDPQLEEVLMWAQAGMRGEGAAEPTITHTEFAGQSFHVQIVRVLILDASNGEFDCVRILRFGGRLCLLGGIKQAQQVASGAGQDLLEGGTVSPDGLDYAGEGCQDSILGIDVEDRLFRGNEPVPEPFAGAFAVESNPVFVPSGLGVGRVAMPDSWKKQESMARFDAHGDIGSRFKGPLAAGNVNERESIENTPMLPVESVTFRVADRRIDGMWCDTCSSRGGNVQAPIPVAAADGKIAIK